MNRESHGTARIDFASVKPVREFRVKTPGGVNISAQEWGNSGGPEVIFIHGFLQSHLSWWKQVTDRELSRKLRMITFDLPGHGGSDKPYDPAVFNNGAHYANTIDALITAWELKKPVLVGWSYGTRVVCDYLMRYGDSHIAGINFVGPSVSTDPKLRGQVAVFSGGTISEDLVQNLTATHELNRSCFHTPPPEGDLDQFTAISMMVPPNIRQWMNRPAPYEETLRAIRVPVLVSYGLEDRLVLLGLPEYVLKSVPHAQASFYENIGHSVCWEAPSRFNEELTEFVEKASRRQPCSSRRF